jgi:hypothetical protein
MSCNTLCPCISSVWEHYSKILHNMHFDHVIWHHKLGICYWMCFCSRRAYNIENMVDIKNLKKIIMQQFVDFKYRIWWNHDWICVWEHYSKILHNMHFDHVIWHHNEFCNIFVWKMSLCVCCDIIKLIWTW